MQRGLPVVVGGASAVVALALLVQPGGGPPAPGAPTIPDRMAGYSYVNGNVSAAPPGRAIALFQFGFGVEFLDIPQAVTVGADGDVHRRVDLAMDRGGPETQGDPAPMLLSPDGTSIAVGDHDIDRPDVLVLDLASADVERFPLPGGRSATPLAWSPDGRTLAYLTAVAPTNPYSGAPVGQDLGLLDLGTGAATTVPGASSVSTVAFSPDGTELAVQRGDRLSVIGTDGTPRRVLRAPRGHGLDGPAAWSPDGALLATSQSWPDSLCADLTSQPELDACVAGYRDHEFAFVDATGSGAPVPTPLPRAVVGYNGVVGWTGPNTALVVSVSEDDPDPARLTEVPLTGGPARVLSTIPTGEGNFGVGRFQLATALLPELQMRPAGRADRGPMPIVAAVGLALLLGIFCAAVVVLTRCRRVAR